MAKGDPGKHQAEGTRPRDIYTWLPGHRNPNSCSLEDSLLLLGTQSRDPMEAGICTWHTASPSATPGDISVPTLFSLLALYG